MKLNKKSQSFSTDIVVVIVIVLFGALFLIMNKINTVESGTSIEDLSKEAAVSSKLIVETLKTEDVIDSENKIDVNKLLQLNEDELKEELGIKDDFAIVFEKDGKLVKIDPENDINCIGSNNIIVNGQECSN